MIFQASKIKGWHLAVAFAAALLLICLLLPSCNIEKRAAAKEAKANRKALDRVRASRPLLDSLTPQILELMGGPDTIAIVLPGSQDSIPYEVPVLDHARYKLVVDSLTDLHSEQCTEAARQAYELGFDEAAAAIRKLKRKAPDTILQTIRRDRQLMDLYNQRINELERNKAQLSGQIAEKDKQITGLQKEARKDFWWLVGAISFAAVTNLLWAYFMFKKPKIKI